MAKAKKSTKKKDDPCWKGYNQLGTKTKGGKKVPNCVPKGKAKAKKSK
ncbi:hypothetical protein SAMN05444372_11289 [Flavobacterium micromati]|jgi:hypothetical protein|uniref:Uncharacterized protein n=1 Tax=Flavobacterium micromati TaxID=229205 RepID=A0A1M5P889_9FLAO|nr:hypothetical protein [Flavobacterium micromati]MCL6461678.1 hypothetical protein [Flavobacterium micromati]SHG97639.1 hypothetical protein SAMN05444372_11289 [Flavobacterium micromati]